MSPPLERVGGRGPSERTLLRVVVVVLAAALLAVVKPWGGGSDTGAGATPRSALVASPAISGSAIPTPIPTPVDPASAFCLLPSDWRPHVTRDLRRPDHPRLADDRPGPGIRSERPVPARRPRGLDVGPRRRLVRPDGPGHAARRTGHGPDLARPGERGAGRARPPAAPRAERPRRGLSRAGRRRGHGRLDARPLCLRDRRAPAGPLVVVRGHGQALRAGRRPRRTRERLRLAGTMSRVWTLA